jgi:UDP-N-acetylglucosamine--N-acetylmuramyl-(pentapeptide) pyrophosphoryl-undecaprenol N-acetylglucosamine transferase
MMDNVTLKKVIISGGGTGGHIFPALAIADEIKAHFPRCEFLFVGAEGKMEMEKVPQAGYNIVGLPIAGFQRKFTVSNFLLPFKIIKSLLRARRIIKNFRPQVVVGVGGYASGPTLKMAQAIGIPTVIQEQNSYPGKTNRLLAKKVKAVCTAYDGLESVFNKSVIVKTGNPVRKELIQLDCSRSSAFESFPSLDPTKKTIFVLGGSLGAKTMNESVIFALPLLDGKNVQVLWQCGNYYSKQLLSDTSINKHEQLFITPFIARMDHAYKLADVVVSRAGALSISELCLVGKPTIFVPSPNVSDDHQTKNAQAIVDQNAALMIADGQANQLLISSALDLLENSKRADQLAENLLKLAKPNAAEDIFKVIQGVVNKSSK